MAQKIEGGMPAGERVGDGWQIVWAAVDPTTGADVSGVVVSNANVVADEVNAASANVGDPILLGVSV